MSIIDLLNKLLGDPNVRELKRLAPVVKRVKEAQKLQEIIDLKLEDVP